VEHAQQVDLVVVGAGPGGEALATGAARAGLEVLLVEKHLVGGECPYYGCVPTKMMVRASDALAEARRAGTLAGDVTVVPSWEPVARRVRDEATDDWDDAVAVRRLEDAGAAVVHGTARLAGRDDEGRLLVQVNAAGGGGTSYAARRGVVLNPGTRPAVPPVEGLADAAYWTNREAVRATSVPAELVVLGGGPIGCELAQVFARFGSRVTVVQHGPRLLPADEPAAGDLLAEVFAEEGIRVLTGRSAERVAQADGRTTVTLDDGTEVSGDRLLLATGRRPNLDDLGLAVLGVEGLDDAARTLPTDELLRVLDARGEPVAGLWAVGDVTGRGAFTHVSMAQSAVALRGVLGQDGPRMRYDAVPHTTFTDPEVAGVGLTAAAAREAGLRVRVGRTDLGASSRGFTHGPGGRGLVTLVEDADRGVLVGASVVGPAAGEVLGLLTLAVHAGVPVDELRTMVYAYPTFHRAVEAAVQDLAEA
jgi:pyruvate/2-oxoglutarate dehydrogenase complex dihydrolipoamide dehydrogenase (E3) component